MKSINKLLQKFARWYSCLPLIFRLLTFVLMATPFALMFIGIWLELTVKLMWEDNFLTYLLATIPSLGSFMCLMIYLSHLSSKNID